MPATRATSAGFRPCATSSRDRATRTLTASPAEFPHDLDLHRLAAQRPLQPRDLTTQLVGLGALRAARALGPGREELLAPLAQQTVGDVVLATELGHRLGATQRREHDLGLLLGRELPVLADLAQRLLLLG
jgi:hypothetical protein